MTLSRRELLALVAAGLLPAPVFPQSPLVKRNMIMRSKRPEDLEMPFDGFSTWITPVERFFVRNHHYYPPRIDLKDWRLQLDGEVQSPQTLTMADLEKLPRTELVGVLECAGNGRAFYDPAITGMQWQWGGVGNGRWTGVRLADVLRKAGLKESAKEILFVGSDATVGTMPHFERTLPVQKAMHADTLLAYQMNGQPLPLQHGFPIRVIAPGWAGDSWVKWVKHIQVLDREFEGFWMKTGYRHPPFSVAPGTAVDPAKMVPVTDLGVKSVIAQPANGIWVPMQSVKISGVAWSGSAPIAAVDISTDSGKSWKPAKLGADQSKYGWRLWEAAWTPPRDGYYVLMARARNSAGDTQPVVEDWNPSGYLWNVTPQVGVNIGTKPTQTNSSAPAATASEATYPNGYKSACLTCHEEDVMRMQRITRTQWDREIDKMVRWGAPVNPDDRQGILEYLATHFGPRK